MPDVSIDTRMFSTEVVVRAEQLSQVKEKQPDTGVPVQESKKLAGKSVMLEQPNQQVVKLVPKFMFIRGKLVRLVQSLNVVEKVVPADISNAGNDVRLEQLRQV